LIKTGGILFVHYGTLGAIFLALRSWVVVRRVLGLLKLERWLFELVTVIIGAAYSLRFRYF